MIGSPLSLCALAQANRCSFRSQSLPDFDHLKKNQKKKSKDVPFHSRLFPPVLQRPQGTEGDDVEPKWEQTNRRAALICFSPIVIDFITVARTVRSRPRLHKPRCLPCVRRTCGEIGARVNMSEAHTQKPTATQRKKKSYSTPYINSGLDKHNRHKRVTP